MAKASYSGIEFDSKLEAEYAARLDLLKHAGEIKEWYYKPFRLRISNAPATKGKSTAFYTVDFGVLMPDNEYEMHETKGHWREAAWVRIRTAAAMHPFHFVAVYKQRGSFIMEPINENKSDPVSVQA